MLRYVLLALVCSLTVNAQAKKSNANDEVAESIARARDAEALFEVAAPAAATTEESSDLKAMLDDAKLVANAAETKSASSVDAATAAETASTETSNALVPAASAQATTEEISKKNEKDIPVLGGKTKSAKTQGSAITRILASLGILTIVLFGTTLALKRWSKRRQGKTQHTAIKVLTQHYIGPKKSIAIIQVAGESILIGVTDHNISMLKTLSLLDEEVPEVSSQNFDTTMNSIGSDINDINDLDLRGLNDIRDKVSRSLRNMKDL